MFFNNTPYEGVGVSMVGELYKQAEEIYPISDELLPNKPSLFQRVVRGLTGRSNEVANDCTICPEGDGLRGSV